MRRFCPNHTRASLPAALLAVVMALLSFPVPSHACLEAGTMDCSCSCRHEAVEAMECCADDGAAAETPACCFTVYVESGMPSLPVRGGTESIPEMSVAVIERAALPPADAGYVPFESARHLHGPRSHLILCQQLV